MEECEEIKHSHNNKNEIKTNLVTLDKAMEKFPYITYPDIMEECGNKIPDDNTP